MWVLAVKGPKDERIRIKVRCFGVPVPWLWNLTGFMKAVEMWEVDREYEGEVDLSCWEGDDRARIVARHIKIGEGGAPFLWWARYPTDCLVVDREGNAWMLEEFETRCGVRIPACYLGIKDLSAFKLVAELLVKNARP